MSASTDLAVMLNLCIEEREELREINAELLDAAKSVAEAITEREQTQAMSDLMTAIAKAEKLQ